MCVFFLFCRFIINTVIDVLTLEVLASCFIIFVFFPLRIPGPGVTKIFSVHSAPGTKHTDAVLSLGLRQM
jgi:hypothetical protein